MSHACCGKTALMPNPRNVLQRIRTVAAVVVANRCYGSAAPAVTELFVLERVVVPPGALKFLKRFYRCHLSWEPTGYSLRKL